MTTKKSVKKMYCRMFQSVMKAGISTIPWRTPKLMKGAGAVRHLPAAIKRRGLKKALIVTGPTLIGRGLLDGVLEEMEEQGLLYVIYNKVEQNPTDENVELGIAATLLTLAGLELLSVIFKSIGMRSSLVVFSTSDKEAINRIARVIYEKGFLLVSYDMKRLGHQEKDEYVVSIVLKARKNTEESPLLLLMEQFPEVTVERIE